MFVGTRSCQVKGSRVARNAVPCLNITTRKFCLQLPWTVIFSHNTGQFMYLVSYCQTLLLINYIKTCLKWPLAKRPKFGFQYQLSLNAGQKNCRILILQYFRPALSYHFSLRSLFCLFLSGCLRQVLLYSETCHKRPLKNRQNKGVKAMW